MKVIINEEKYKNLDPKEIGERLINVMNKFNEMGVFYRMNMSGKYHEKYPHNCFSFKVCFDKHFEGQIYDGCSGLGETICASAGKSPVEDLIDVLENSEYLLKQLTE